MDLCGLPEPAAAMGAVRSPRRDNHGHRVAADRHHRRRRGDRADAQGHHEASRHFRTRVHEPLRRHLQARHLVRSLEHEQGRRSDRISPSVHRRQDDQGPQSRLRLQALRTARPRGLHRSGLRPHDHGGARSLREPSGSACAQRSALWGPDAVRLSHRCRQARRLPRRSLQEPRRQAHPGQCRRREARRTRLHLLAAASGQRRLAGRARRRLHGLQRIDHQQGARRAVHLVQRLPAQRPRHSDAGPALRPRQYSVRDRGHRDGRRVGVAHPAEEPRRRGLCLLQPVQERRRRDPRVPRISRPCRRRAHAAANDQDARRPQPPELGEELRRGRSFKRLPRAPRVRRRS